MTKTKSVNAKEVTLTNGDLKAVVRYNGGTVEVEREDIITVFRPTYTIEDVVNRFVSEGWEKSKEGIPAHICKGVNRYLELHIEQTRLKREMDKLKKEIRGYMDENEIQVLQGDGGREIYLQDAKASNSTSRYTDYELKDIMDVEMFTQSDIKAIVEPRVNAEELEILLKSGRFPTYLVDAIRDSKVYKEGTPRFAVRNS